MSTLSIPGAVSSPQISKRHIECLTGIRFYAALAVFASHLTLFGAGMGIHAGTIEHFFKNLGGLGVAVFFVLSGAIMVLNYVTCSDDSLSADDRPKVVSPWQYWQARLARIYPAYLVSYFFLVPLLWWQQSPHFTWANMLGNLSFMGLVNIQMPVLNPPAWSILPEVLFYLLFPLVLPLLCQQFWKNWTILLVSYTAIFGLIHWPGGLGPEFLKNAICGYSRMFEFIFGMGLGGYLLTKRVGPWQLGYKGSVGGLYAAVTVSLVGMMLTQVLYHILGNYWPINWSYYAFLFPVPFAMGLIGALYLLETRGAKLTWLRHPWVQWGGEVSYSFYLLHYTVLGYGAMALRTWGHLNPLTITGPSALGLFVLLLGVTLGLSALCYQWVELPGRRWIRSWQRPKWLGGTLVGWSKPTMAKAT